MARASSCHRSPSLFHLPSQPGIHEGTCRSAGMKSTRYDPGFPVIANPITADSTSSTNGSWVGLRSSPYAVERTVKAVELQVLKPRIFFCKAERKCLLPDMGKIISRCLQDVLQKSLDGPDGMRFMQLRPLEFNFLSKELSIG